MFQSVNCLFLAANALKVFIFYIMFRVFIWADSISNKTMMPDIFEHPCFLNDLFIFQLVKKLRYNVTIYFFVAKETPNSLAIVNSTLLSRLNPSVESALTIGSIKMVNTPSRLPARTSVNTRSPTIATRAGSIFMASTA